MFVTDVLDLWYSGYFLFQLQKGSDKKKRRLNKKKIYQKTAARFHSPQWYNRNRNRKFKPESRQSRETRGCCRRYKSLWGYYSYTQNKIISIAYHQGKVFKRLKDKEKFIKLIKELKVHKSTIIFKTNIFELIDKHPKLIKSSTTFCFLKNYDKDIKEILKKIQARLNR